MSQHKKTDRRPVPAQNPLREKLLIALGALCAAVLTLVFYGGSYKGLALAACLFACLLPLIAGRKPAWRNFVTPLSLALFVYVVYCGIGGFYALSGKFFLREYSKLLVCLPLFLAVGCSVAKEQTNARRVAALFSGIAACFSILSVEASSTGLVKRLLESQSGFSGLGIGFEAGTRMTGIFGNANILAGALAIGCFFSLYLLQSAEGVTERLFDTFLLGVNAFGFLMAFSMGAIAAFGAACVIYLVFAGKDRPRVFLRMVETVVFAVAGAALAFPAFGKGSPLPLLLLVLVPGALYLCDRYLCDRLTKGLENRGKVFWAVLLIVVLLAGAFLAAGLTLTGSYTFGQKITRSLYPSAGENSIQAVSRNGDVTVQVRSQNAVQVMLHNDTTLYKGAVENAVFTVPEDAVVVHFDLSGSEGSTLDSAVLASGEKIKLKYKLLPGFIANRLQGLWANQNAIQRTVFFKDGMNLFRRSPVFGNGLGSFETAIFGVQSFYYETKYVHNNYVQVLLEGGILGAVLYLGMLALALIALLRRRGLDKLSGRIAALHPALCAAFLFLLIHSGVEVTMSTIVFLPFAFTLFALISSLFSEPLAERKPAAGRAVSAAFRYASAAYAGLFALLLILNISAYRLVTGGLNDIGEYYKALDTAVKIDPFEKADYHLSYVANSNQMPDNAMFAELASPHAEKLSTANSNTTAPSVILYYINQGKLLEAAKTANYSLRYNRANAETWSTELELLCSAVFSNDQYAVYFSEDGKAFAGEIHEIAAFYQETNRTLLSPLTLSDPLLAFLDLNETVYAAASVSDDDYQTAAITSTLDTRTALDFNGDGSTELITVKDGTRSPDGSFRLEPGGSITLRPYLPYTDTRYRISVDTEEEVAVSCGDITLNLVREDGSLFGGIMPQNPGLLDIVVTAPDGAEIGSVTVTRD